METDDQNTFPLSYWPDISIVWKVSNWMLVLVWWCLYVAIDSDFGWFHYIQILYLHCIPSFTNMRAIHLENRILKSSDALSLTLYALFLIWISNAYKNRSRLDLLKNTYSKNLSENSQHLAKCSEFVTVNLIWNIGHHPVQEKNVSHSIEQMPSIEPFSSSTHSKLKLISWLDNKRNTWFHITLDLSIEGFYFYKLSNYQSYSLSIFSFWLSIFVI